MKGGKWWNLASEKTKRRVLAIETDALSLKLEINRTQSDKVQVVSIGGRYWAEILKNRIKRHPEDCMYQKSKSSVTEECD